MLCFFFIFCEIYIFVLVDRNMSETEMTLPKFLTTDLTGKLMTQIKLPPLSKHYKLVTYKVS